ncbi:MAG: hypothetical protein FJ387_24680 [Verrucomicrobia bacterium]|nr:hypothetical protein [Verrucomicrobiota bacterium]
MANEISITASLTGSKGGATLNSGALSKTLDMAGADFYSTTLTVTSGAEVTHAIPSGIGDCGWILIKNLDASNYVKVGFATADYKIRIPAGSFALFRPEDLAIANLYLRADTADCLVQIWILEA